MKKLVIKMIISRIYIKLKLTRELAQKIELLMYRVFIKYCVFSEDFKNIPDSGLSLFSLGVSMCTHTRQVEHQRCSRTGRVQKKTQYLMNTL